MKYASSVILGTLGPSNVLAGKQIRDVTKGISRLYEQNQQAPLFALQTETMTGAPSKNPKHEWTYKYHFPRWDTVAGTISNNGTAAITFAPTNIDYYRQFDTVKFHDVSGNTNHGYVSTKGASTIIVSSLDGSTTLPTVAAGTVIEILGVGSEDYSRMPTPKQVQDVQDYNYPVFLRYPTQIGMFELEMAQYTGPERDERITEQMEEIKLGFERHLIWGERGIRSSGTDTGNLYHMRGIVPFIENGAGDNLLPWSTGSLTQNTFDEWYVSGPGKYGSKKKWFFRSTELLMKMHSWSDTKGRIEAAGGHVTIMGIAFTKYLAPNGDILYFHEHHQFEDQYEGAGLIVDPKYFKIIPYGKRKMFTFHADIQENDRAGEANEWQVVATCEPRMIEPHGYIYQ